MIDGVVFCHYICSGVHDSERPSAANATSRFVQGHVQQRDIAEGLRATGSGLVQAFPEATLATSTMTDNPARQAVDAGRTEPSTKPNRGASTVSLSVSYQDTKVHMDIHYAKRMPSIS